MVLSIHISSSESGACARIERHYAEQPASHLHPSFFRCTEHHSATPPRQQFASINTGSPSKNVALSPHCSRRRASTALADLCMSVHRVSHNLRLLFQCIPQLFRHFRCNDVVAGIFKCLCQRSGQRDFHHINGVTIFAINTSHHMPATIRQLLVIASRKRYFPTFSTLPRYCSFPPRRAV